MIARILCIVSLCLVGMGVFWFITEYAEVREEIVTKTIDSNTNNR